MMKNGDESKIPGWFIRGCWLDVFRQFGRTLLMVLMGAWVMLVGWLEFFWPEIKALIETDDIDRK